MDKIERRYFNSGVEIRGKNSGKLGGKGMAARYNILSENLGGFREKIAPGFFDGVIDNDVRVLRDHEKGKILGRTSKGTASISLTDEGLYYEWDDPDTSYSRDLQKSMARGDVDQSSFGFTVLEDSWDEDEDGLMIRTLIKARELFDVSPVTFPAYPDATVAKRSLDQYLESKKPEEKEIKSNNKQKQITKMDRIKTHEDELKVLIQANEDILSNLENGQGEARSLTEEERDSLDSNKTEIERVEHLLEHYKAIEARKAGVKKDTRTEAEKAEKRGYLVGHESKPPDSEEREAADFNFMKFLSGVKKGTLTGLEREMAQEGDKSFRSSGAENSAVGGFKIPNKVLEARKETRAVMISGTVASPGEAGKAVQEEIRSFIDHLYASLALVQAGADFQTGLVGNQKWPAENAVAAGTWEGEVTGNAESTPTNTNISMAPLRVGTYVDVSSQALLQTSPSVGARIERQMVNAIAQAVDIAGINGSGTPPIPEGILQTTGIGDVALGTNGLAPTWDSIVNLEKEVAIDNALMGNLSYVTNAAAYAALKKVKKDAGSGIYLIDSLMGEGASSLNNHRVVISNNVPSDLDKGTSTGVCSAIIFGNFNDVIIGQWGGVEVLIDPYTQALTGTTRYVINSFHDIGVLRAASFAAILDALTA